MAENTPMVPKQAISSEPLAPPKDAIKQAMDATMLMICTVASFSASE